MNIRPAQEREAEALSALALKAKAYWGYPADTIESWKQELSVSSDAIASMPTFVAAVGDEIAGFYSLVPSTRSWKLDHLWVLPQFMDRGIGRALVAHALETALRGASARRKSAKQKPFLGSRSRRKRIGATRPTRSNRGSRPPP